MANQTNMYLAFFDQVLDEIVIGNTDQGIGRMLGMLDGLALHECSLGTARRALNRHALQQLLFETPLDRQTDQLAPDVRHLDPAELRLTRATENVAIVRALHQRRKFAAEKLARAWQNEQRICLFGPAIIHPAPIVPRDHPSITVVEGGAAELAVLADHDTAGFDLICAPDALDGCDTVALVQLLAAVHRLIAPCGTAIVSAMLPHYTGAGWAQVCLNWQPHVHTEAALRVAAAAAGLSSQLFRDATGCLVWCMLQRTPGDLDRGIENACR